MTHLLHICDPAVYAGVWLRATEKRLVLPYGDHFWVIQVPRQFPDSSQHYYSSYGYQQYNKNAHETLLNAGVAQM